MAVDPFVALGVDRPDAGPPAAVKSGIDPFAALGVAPGDYQPTPAPPKPGAGILQNFTAGANRTIFGALGAPVDLATGAMNLVPRAINAAAGTHVPLIENPVGGSDWMQTQFGKISVDPRAVQPQDEAERIASAAGGAAATVPLMALGGAGAVRALPAAAPSLLRAVPQAVVESSPMRAAVPVAVGGGVGQAAEDAVPEPYKPLANLAGNLVGAAGAQGIAEAARLTASPIRNAAGMAGFGAKQDVNGIRATGSQISAAGRQVSGALGAEGQQALSDAATAESRATELQGIIADPATPAADKAAAQASLQQTPQREQIVPGSMPTTAQIAPTPGAVALEKAHRVGDAAPFIERAQQQNSARLAAVQGLAPEDARPGAVGELFRRQLDQIDAAGQSAVSTARQGVQAATEGLGGQAPAEAGQDIRGALGARNAAAKQRENALWEAIDPDGKLALPLGGVQETARGLLKDMAPQLGDVAGGQETQILNGAAQLPDVVPFRYAQRLRSNIGFAERALRAQPGNDQSLRRLGLLKSSLDDTIAHGAETAAQGDPAVAARLQALREGENGGQAGLDAGAPRLGYPGQGVRGPLSGGDNQPAAASVVSQRPGSQNEGNRGSGLGAGNRPLASGAATEVAPAHLRKPESIVDFLISHGGIQDQGGDLKAIGADAVHHQKGGRLVNPRGVYPDYARESAEEAGFLKPGSTTRDLYDALAEHISGRPVYRISEQAEGNLLAQTQRNTAREEAAYDRARYAVGRAEEAAGARLSSDEIEHATRLTMLGAHPEDALQQAARGGEEGAFQRNAERNAFGLPGVPPSAQQTEIGVAGRSKLQPNFDAGAAERYAKARAQTLDRKQTFGQGAVGRTLQAGQQGADYRLAAAEVPRQFLTGNAVEPARVQQYIQAVGGEQQAVAHMRDALVGDLREKGIVQPDGTIKPGAYDTWVQRRGRTIDLFPGLRDQLGNAGTAQQTLDDVTAAHKAAVDEFNKSAAAKFINDDPAKAVASAFGGSNPTQTFTGLMRQVRGNPDAEAGLRRAVVDFIVDKTKSATPAGETEDFLKAATFRSWVRHNNGPLKALFGGQGVQNLDMVAADLRRQAQMTTATPGSDTVQKAIAARRHGLGAQGVTHMTALAVIGEQLGDVISETLGGGGITGKVVGASLGIGSYLFHSLRQAGISTVNDLVREAMLHPDVARELMARAQNGKIGPVAAQRIARSLQATIAANAMRPDTKERPQ